MRKTFNSWGKSQCFFLNARKCAFNRWSLVIKSLNPEEGATEERENEVSFSPPLRGSISEGVIVEMQLSCWSRSSSVIRIIVVPFVATGVRVGQIFDAAECQ